MTRQKSNHICEKCGERGFIRTNPYSVQHFDSNTGRTKRCYVKRLVEKARAEKKNHEYKNSGVEQNLDLDLPTRFNEEHITAELPPRDFWGQSELYRKIGHLRSRFIKIAKDLGKIQKRVYYYRPQRKTSLKACKHIREFENNFLNPVEKILAPYHDLRYSCDWSDMFNIQMNVIEYGLSGSAKKNLIPTGEFISKTYKDGSVDLVGLGREFAPSYLKKNQYRTLKFAMQLIDTYALQRAFSPWYHTTRLVEEVQTKDNKDVDKSVIEHKPKLKGKGKAV